MEILNVTGENRIKRLATKIQVFHRPGRGNGLPDDETTAYRQRRHPDRNVWSQRRDFHFSPESRDGRKTKCTRAKKTTQHLRRGDGTVSTTTRDTHKTPLVSEREPHL